MGRPDDRAASFLRFATELIAWVATPWALAGSSWLAWPFWAAVPVTLPAAVTVVTERRRRRWPISAH
ncbi:hypothetical protein NE235_17485 [Actinoallomurus spadix]|uniref:hypothetical protein n=1 Tax=Actinoallomurus spadix TaxID=79912 RepID=UPI002093AAF3|nr:hypothetical protein [Actinoallomurus spadix]MCO5987897.1 hypothetical protein [Actinoallomurus spadix]